MIAARSLSCPIRTIRSRSPAPLVAAHTLPLWRRSWKCSPLNPMAATARYHAACLLKLPRRSGPPLGPGKTSPSGPGALKTDRCWVSAGRITPGTPTTRRPARDLGGPRTNAARTRIVPAFRSTSHRRSAVISPPMETGEGGREHERPIPLILRAVRLACPCRQPQHFLGQCPTGIRSRHRAHLTVRAVAQPVAVTGEPSHVPDRTTPHQVSQLKGPGPRSAPGAQSCARCRRREYGRDHEAAACHPRPLLQEPPAAGDTPSPPWSRTRLR